MPDSLRASASRRLGVHIFHPTNDAKNYLNIVNTSTPPVKADDSTPAAVWAKGG